MFSNKASPSLAINIWKCSQYEQNMATCAFAKNVRNTDTENAATWTPLFFCVSVAHT